MLTAVAVLPAPAQAVAEHWASDAGWSVVGVTATGDRVLVQATGPNPAPDLAVLRRDLNDAGLNGLDVRGSLVPASYKPLPGEAAAAGFIDRPFSSQATGGRRRRLGLRLPKGGGTDPRECAASPL
jgi:hypothetical protein